MKHQKERDKSMLKDIFEERKGFKLVCGAGNEDADEVEKLVTIYSLAGCPFFDVCAKPEIVDAARNLGVVVDPHDYINKLEENYDIHDIVNVFISNNEKWESYTRMVDSWISARKIEFDRERIIVEQ